MLIHWAADDDIHPPRTGGTQRTFGLARGLAARHAVRVLCVVPNRSRAPRESSADGVMLIRRRAWHTGVAWRLERLGLAPLFAGEAAHRARAARYAAALEGVPDVLSVDLNLAGMLPPSRARLRVYASQNVEADRFLSAGPRILARSHWAKRLRALEGGAVRDADLTVACSEEDAARLRALYGAREDEVAVIANGYDERVCRPPAEAERRAARAALGLTDDVYAALFVGADWGPNREALAHLVDRVMPALAGAGVRLLVAGSVCRSLAGRREPWLHALGVVDDLTALLHAADAGLNPVAEGGGSNVKLPGYLAAGLACITTSFGTRGYPDLVSACLVADRRAFAELLAARPAGWAASGGPAPAALERYAWSALGARLGDLLEARMSAAPARGGA